MVLAQMFLEHAIAETRLVPRDLPAVGPRLRWIAPDKLSKIHFLLLDKAPYRISVSAAP
jgi:hypothetical protein